MRILVISTNSDEAGAPRHAETIISQLSDVHDFSFVSGEQGPVFRRLESKGVPVYYFAELRNKFSPFVDLVCLVKLLKIIKQSRPDILHLHSAKAGMLGRICGLVLGIPMVYTVHGWGWRGMSFIPSFILKSIEYIFKYVPNVAYVFVSESLVADAKNILKFQESQFNVIHNGISDMPATLEYTQRDMIKLIMPARVCMAKDHKTLLKAYTKLPNNFALTLCGEGTDEPSFRTFVHSIVGDRIINIDFLGMRSDVDELLESSDIFVLSSVFEALPISIIEAMCMGLPVVASNVGGVAELVIDRESGFLFETGNYTQLALILKSLSHVELRRNIGKSARLRFLNHFLVDQMIISLNDVYLSAKQSRS